MPEFVLYHNPRCSKSRQARELLDARGIDYQTRLYLKEPLDQAELKTLIAELGIPARQLLRTKEAEYQTAGLGETSSESDVIQAMATYPKLMERPILAGPNGARIGRPPEAILDLV